MSQDLRMNTAEEFELNKRFSSYLMKQANPNILGHLKSTQVFEKAQDHEQGEPRPELRPSDCDIVDSTMNRSHFHFGEMAKQERDPYLPVSMNAMYVN
mmetsp:Transcript_9147/g.13905  ORF Transcript_9147/g.13905 Transcript_9147/m.13905 type:complete len:98 (+) Transcript_9147:109-402(+)